MSESGIAVGQGQFGNYTRETFNSWSEKGLEQYAPWLSGLLHSLAEFPAEQQPEMVELAGEERGLGQLFHGLTEMVGEGAERMRQNLEQEALMVAFMAMFGAPQKETLHLGSAQVFAELRAYAEKAENLADRGAEQMSRLVSRLHEMVIDQLARLEQQRVLKLAELAQAKQTQQGVQAQSVSKTAYKEETAEVTQQVTANTQGVELAIQTIDDQLTRFTDYLAKLRTIEFGSVQRQTGTSAA